MLEDVIDDILVVLTWSERQKVIGILRDISDARIVNGQTDFPFSDISMMMLQSGDESTESHTEIHGSGQTQSVDTKQEVIASFTDKTSGNSYSRPGYLDPSYGSDAIANTGLEEFLARPVRIYTVDWTEGTALNAGFDPWFLFLNDTSVSKKISNYCYLQANMHLKVVVNASPFYYGGAIMSYRPLPAFCPTTISDNFSSNLAGSGRNGYLMGLSQLPHIKIFPQTCEGGEIMAPFFYHKDWLNISSATDVTNMARCAISSIVSLANANSVSNGVCTITVFAWLDNVRLAGPTVLPVLQAKDEYTGPVSAPASAVAKFSNYLTGVPYIGPFAKATGMIATGVASIASLLGFTNVPIIEDVKPMKSLVYHSFASTEISQPIEKLTVDPKNELTIDPRVVGLDGKDELLVSTFVEKEAYMDTFTWASTSAVDSVLWNYSVSPEITIAKTVSGVTAYQRTPMSHLCKMFGYWRGPIILRFKILKTKYHSGRLMIQWDPLGDVAAATGAFNQVLTKVVDITGTDDLEFEIPYNQPTHYLCTADYAGADPDVTYFGSGTPVYNSTVHNGRLTIKVLSSLTSPVDPATIYVSVFARGGKDLHFANPIDMNQDISLYKLQSGNEMGQNLVFHGERIVSLRQLLRRTSLSRMAPLGENGAANFMTTYTFKHSPQPLQRGYDANGINLGLSTIGTPASKAYNYCLMTPYNFIAPAFIGYRGSHNWHYNVNGKRALGDLRAMRVSTGIASISSYAGAVGVSDSSWTVNKNGNYSVKRSPGSAGQSATNQLTQAGLSVQYPMYSRYRMLTTDPSATTKGTSNDDSNLSACQLELTYQSDDISNNDKYIQVTFYHSIGTDFSLLYLLNVPSYYYVPSAAAG